MDKFTLVFRGGCPDNIAAGIDDILGEVNLQNHIFITDVKSHSVEMVAVAEARSLFNNLKGKYGLSIIQSYNHQQHGLVVCFGKLQDGDVVKTIQDKARGLF